jgi:hypothetical protein
LFCHFFKLSFLLMLFCEVATLVEHDIRKLYMYQTNGMTC